MSEESGVEVSCSSLRARRDFLLILHFIKLMDFCEGVNYL